MKKNRSFPICFLVILSMTVLNVVSQYYFCEKTFNIVAFSLTGLITVFLLISQTNSLYRQFLEAKIIPARRYTLIKLVKVENGHGALEIAGAILGFWEDTEKKQILFFKDVVFSAETDFCRHKRFVGVKIGDEVILKPLN